MIDQSTFIRQALHDLQARTEAAAKRHPGMRHMLVLPPGESIRVPSPRGVDPRELGCERLVKRKNSVRYQFGKSKIFGPLPPDSSWPKRIEPLRAFVVGEKLGSNLPYVQEPYRMHLFFGGNADAFNNLQVLANDLGGLRADVERALPCKVFCAANRDDDDIASLDSWLCTIHWWAWTWTECPYRTKPQVVYAGRTYPTDPGDDSVKSKLSFSLFDADILTASTVTLSLILRFFDEPPTGSWSSEYPGVPRSDVTLSADGKKQVSHVPKPLVTVSPNDSAPPRLPAVMSAGEHTPEALEHLKPSHQRAKALYEWGMVHIDGAENMTYAELYRELTNNPHCAGEGLPGDAETFARYCRSAGIHRNTSRQVKHIGRSVRRESDI